MCAQIALLDDSYPLLKYEHGGLTSCAKPFSLRRVSTSISPTFVLQAIDMIVEMSAESI